MNAEQSTLDPVTPSPETINPRRSIAKKIVALVIVIVLLVGFTLLVYALTTKRNPIKDLFPKSPEPEILTESYCSGLPEAEVMEGFGDFTFPRDNCFRRLASQTGDEKYCTYLEASEFDSCLTGIAGKLLDTSICEERVDPLYRNSCYSTIAQESKDTKYCKKLDTQFKRDDCIQIIVNILEDINICDEMEDKSPGGNYEGCIAFMAYKFNECSILYELSADIDEEVIDNAYAECLDRESLERLQNSRN